ncbi:MAG: hypothetical protein JXA54_07540 [Candidatus Heimdallarchaeota archaeon]|nr:hypothetical protein [Candidatus Heimdallarchaeota archaeon]
MNKLRNEISLFTIVLILAGITTAFVPVHGLTTFYGTVENPSDDPVNGVTVLLYDSYFYILGADTTDSNGDYSFTATLNDNSPYYLFVMRTRFDTESKQVTSGGGNNFELEGDGYKLAYLFYANDATDQDIMEEYKDILEAEDFIVEIIPDCLDVEAECEDIADYEIYSDTIFVYVMGHGEYDEEEENSYTDFNMHETQFISSETFKGCLDDWEAERVFLFVDSCFSGGWVDDFHETPYLVMSSSDDSHYSYRFEYMGNWEGRFSDKFFYYVDEGDTAVQAFNNAELYFDEETDDWPSYPQIEDNSSYTWFN